MLSSKLGTSFPPDIINNKSGLTFCANFSHYKPGFSPSLYVSTVSSEITQLCYFKKYNTCTNLFLQIG
uniref:Uncharacterized protein n=1 Tax=Arion vulgaris TaxID=1028688 RepID=A0A0B7AYF5_9EUPU